jgi:mannose-6-phosphate isomerase-like protein (cupin superfamily)
VADGIRWETLPTVLKGPDTEIRREDHGQFAVCILRLSAGADTRPVFEGLPDDQCQCEHWGYIMRGTIRVHCAGRTRTYEAGEAYHWPPGHNLEALTDCEYLEISAARDYDRLMEHVRGAAG